MGTVRFTRMEDGSKQDYLLLDRLESENTSGAADRIILHLNQLRNSLGGYKIDRTGHSLQAATRAYPSLPEPTRAYRHLSRMQRMHQ